MKDKIMINSGDESIFVPKEKGMRYMVGSGEHATFVSDDMKTIKILIIN